MELRLICCKCHKPTHMNKLKKKKRIKVRWSVGLILWGTYFLCKFWQSIRMLLRYFSQESSEPTNRPALVGKTKKLAGWMNTLCELIQCILNKAFLTLTPTATHIPIFDWYLFSLACQNVSGWELHTVKIDPQGDTHWAILNNLFINNSRGSNKEHWQTILHMTRSRVYAVSRPSVGWMGPLTEKWV